MKYLIYLFASILVLPTEIKDVHADGVCFQEIKIDKMEPNIVRSIWGCHGYSWGVFVNVGKRVLKEVNRDILAGLLAKEC